MNRQKEKLKHKTNNMKKLVFLLFPVMLLLGLASCTDDDNVQNAEGPNRQKRNGAYGKIAYEGRNHFEGRNGPPTPSPPTNHYDQ